MDRCPCAALFFSASAERGARTAAGVFALTGRLLFLHRPCGVRELRQRVRPGGRHLFLHRPSGGRELRQRVRPFRAGSFSLNLSGGIHRRRGGNVPRPAAGAKRKGHLRFPFLFGLLPFPCFLIWRRFPICDRCEKEVRQRIFSSVSFATDSQCQITYCYTDRQLSAGAT